MRFAKGLAAGVGVWAALGAIGGEPARASFHFPASSRTQVAERGLRAFLFHDGQLAHLVAQAEVEAVAPGRKGAALPRELAWVLPFPSLPTRYEEASSQIFSQLERLTRPAGKGKGGSAPAAARKASAQASGARSLRVHARQVVGGYEIQPIEVLSDGAGEALDAWLKRNRFNPLPAARQRPYLRKGAAFLAIRVRHARGSRLRLKPLHVAYADDQLRFPLRFAESAHAFDLDLYVLTQKPLKRGTLRRFARMHLAVAGSGEYSRQRVAERAPLVVAQVEDGGLSPAPDPGLAQLLGGRSGLLTRLSGRGLNSPAKPLAKLAGDPVIGRSKSRALSSQAGHPAARSAPTR